MTGKAKANETGKDLEDSVRQLAARLDLKSYSQVRTGRRIWGSERRIDVILEAPSGKRLGIECKYQGTGGTAEEKIPAVIQDLGAWPIDGLVVFHGEGFSTNMTSFLLSTGKAVLLEDLEVWLRLYFGLPLA